jgi:hypothetical protein
MYKITIVKNLLNIGKNLIDYIVFYSIIFKIDKEISNYYL